MTKTHDTADHQIRASAMRLDIDLAFSREEHSRDGKRSARFSGSITASGKHIRVTLDHDSLVVNRSKALQDFASLFAEGLAAQGLSLSLEVPSGQILTMGDVSASVVKRMFTRSKHIDVVSLRRLSRLMKKRSSGAEIRDELLVPPPTLWPLVPTVQRQMRRQLTTTHHTRGSGRPRLMLVKEHPEFGPGALMEFNLEQDMVVIGSSDDCDLQLSGTDSEHAEIIHSDKDEYILMSRGVIGGSTNPESRKRVVLRTGSRIQMGPWRLVFHREEYADHGRPFGGRQGGEFSAQRTQPNPYRGGRT